MTGVKILLKAAVDVAGHLEYANESFVTAGDYGRLAATRIRQSAEMAEKVYRTAMRRVIQLGVAPTSAREIKEFLKAKADIENMIDVIRGWIPLLHGEE